MNLKAGGYTAHYPGGYLLGHACILYSSSFQQISLRIHYLLLHSIFDKGNL